jgi:hypothetical protein
MIQRCAPLIAIVLACALSACETTPGKKTAPAPKPAVTRLKQVTLLPVQVTSKELDIEALTLNTQWQGIATDQLRALLSKKNIGVSDYAPSTVGGRIDMSYGDRTLRNVAGTAAGHIRVTIQHKDKLGKLLQSADAEADFAGSDAARIVRETIQSAVNQLGAKL